MQTVLYHLTLWILMRETLEKLAKEDDKELLAAGVKEFYRKNRGVLNMLHTDVQEMAIEVMDMVKLVTRHDEISDDDVKDLKRILSKVIKRIEYAEEKSHDLLHDRLNAA